MTEPLWEGVGTPAASIGNITPGRPASIGANDILLLFVESGNTPISDPSGGWVPVADSPQFAAGGSAATHTGLFIWWFRGDPGADPTVVDPGNHLFGIIARISGCITTGDPWNVTAGDADTTADTAVDIPGDTTTVANCLVVAAASTGFDSLTGQFSSWANANLSSVTERININTDQGNGGGIGVVTGVKASAGAFGATTATLANSSKQGRIMLALKPVEEVSNDRQGRVYWAEAEAPNAPRQGRVYWNELETPNAPRQGRVYWAEAETPNAPRQGRVYWNELETPDAPRRGQVYWTELEAPDLASPRQGQVYWAELEAPNVPRQGRVYWGEVETPDAPRQGRVHWVEVETPNAPRQGRVYWAEVETTNAPRSGRLYWAETEVPDPPRQGRLYWVELESPDAPSTDRQGRVYWAEIEAPNLVAPEDLRQGQVYYVEFEVPATGPDAPDPPDTTPRRGLVFFVEVETPAVGG